MDKRKKLKDFKNLLNEDESGERDEEDDRKILFDDFVQGLVSRLTDKDTSSLSQGDLKGSIQQHCLKKMFKADDRDEYYNYKSRYYKAPEISRSVMHLIQKGPDRADQMGDPKFVDYANVSQNMSIFEDESSPAQRKIMDLACEYKMMDQKNEQEKIKEFLNPMPQSLREKVKSVAENISRKKLEEFQNEDQISEETIRNEVRNVISNLKKKEGELKREFFGSVIGTNASKTEKEFRKAAESGEPRRYKNVTIDANVAEKALELADNLDISRETFFSKPVSKILAITTANM